MNERPISSYYIRNRYGATDILIEHEQAKTPYRVIGKVLEFYLSNRFSESKEYLDIMYQGLHKRVGRGREYCQNLVDLETLMKEIELIEDD